MASGGGIAVLEQFLGVFARRFGLAATVRASYGPYSLAKDTDVLLEALSHAVKMFG